MTPDPISLPLCRKLIDQGGGTNHVATLLHVESRTTRRWYSGDSPIPWAAAECLAAYLEQRPPALSEPQAP